MKVLGVSRLEAFYKKHNQAKGPLEAWLDDVKRADWKTPQDIKNGYKTASFIHGNVAIFNIKGNTYRLSVNVQYAFGQVLILWVGTHAEYDKVEFWL
ncbi:type II toxin-antitoxin system HigB family toxin [Budvicia diplopodorum]|uniref:type II toxin-antitoxin system HigB family toxin n=1 Tax=Budvicia diplopodorum TaxID=1119056 RepID=UPI00135B8EDF|nr:type II toxin-antitoxin system HigB family toxin [Budvicia diplopodorum]